MKLKFTEEKGVSLIVVAIILIAIVVVAVIAKTVINQSDEKMNETVLNEVSKVALQIQKEKANLKSSLQKEVTTEDTLNYLEQVGIIDEENNIINEKVEGLKLLGNGIITYNGVKKGQVLLTDYYDKKEVKTIWTQDNSVNNNLVTIQINDGKFVEAQEDANYKVWKYKFEAYDDDIHGRFSYWMNEVGDIISTENVLYESASVDRIYTAVYNSEISVEPENRVSLNLEKVDNSIVGVLEGMHYAKDITEKVYSLDTRKYENYDIKGSRLDRIGLVFTLNEEKAKSEDFGCTSTGDDVGYTTIFDRTKENFNTLVSYNYNNSGIIMISQAINITLDAINSLGPKTGDTIYIKPFMLFSVDETGYYINGDFTYELTY